MSQYTFHVHKCYEPLCTFLLSLINVLNIFYRTSVLQIFVTRFLHTDAFVFPDEKIFRKSCEFSSENGAAKKETPKAYDIVNSASTVVIIILTFYTVGYHTLEYGIVTIWR